MTYERKRMALFARLYSAFFFENYFINIENRKEKERCRKRLTQILGFKPSIHKNFSIQHRAFKEDLTSIRVYLAIEKEMGYLFEHRADGYSFIIEDYGYALLEPAIERVVGNTFSKLNDSEFAIQHEQLKTKYRGIYYSVAYKYKLPTIGVLAFMLRLITPPSKHNK